MESVRKWAVVSPVQAIAKASPHTALSILLIAEGKRKIPISVEFPSPLCV